MIVENYFDLYDLFVNELVGDIWLFIIIALVGIIYIGIKTKMPTDTIFLLGGLFLAVFFAATRGTIGIIWVLFVFSAAIIFYLKFVKIGKG